MVLSVISTSRKSAASKLIVVLLLLLGVVGCGGGKPSSPSSASIQVSSDARLVAMWQQAQYQLAYHLIEINAAYAALGLEQPEWVAADLGALTASSSGVTVTPVPDVTPGIIDCPSDAVEQRCHCYVQGNAIFVAQSLLYSQDATGYEMENVILEKLGYDVSKR